MTEYLRRIRRRTYRWTGILTLSSPRSWWGHYCNGPRLSLLPCGAIGVGMWGGSPVDRGCTYFRLAYDSRSFDQTNRITRLSRCIIHCWNSSIKTIARSMASCSLNWFWMMCIGISVGTEELDVLLLSVTCWIDWRRRCWGIEEAIGFWSRVEMCGFSSGSCLLMTCEHNAREFAQNSRDALSLSNRL